MQAHRRAAPGPGMVLSEAGRNAAATARRALCRLPQPIRRARLRASVVRCLCFGTAESLSRPDGYRRGLGRREPGCCSPSERLRGGAGCVRQLVQGKTREEGGREGGREGWVGQHLRLRVCRAVMIGKAADSDVAPDAPMPFPLPAGGVRVGQCWGRVFSLSLPPSTNLFVAPYIWKRTASAWTDMRCKICTYFYQCLHIIYI